MQGQFGEIMRSFGLKSSVDFRNHLLIDKPSRTRAANHDRNGCDHGRPNRDASAERQLSHPCFFRT
jgi:hypothetical protein